MSISPTANYEYGHTCPTCGTWVSYGVFHQCGTAQPSPVAAPTVTFWPANRDNEILATLSEIRDLLKKLVERHA